MPRIRLRRLTAATAIGLSALLAAPTAVSAEPEPTGTTEIGSPEDDAVADHDERTQAIIDALVAAGVPEELIDDEFLSRIRASVRELVEEGIVEPEALDELREAARNGELGDKIAERVERNARLRAEYREAVADALEELGVEVTEGVSPRQALREAGYEPSEIRDLLPRRHDVYCDLHANDDKEETGNRRHRSCKEHDRGEDADDDQTMRPEHDEEEEEEEDRDRERRRRGDRGDRGRGHGRGGNQSDDHDREDEYADDDADVDDVDDVDLDDDREDEDEDDRDEDEHDRDDDELDEVTTTTTAPSSSA